MGDLKVLSVRDHFRNGVIQVDDTEIVVLQIPEGNDFSIGFARIVNEGGVAKFKMLEKFVGKIKVTPTLSVPHTGFNGVAVEDVCERPFVYGDVVEMHVGYKDTSHVSRDTVVLVPERTPAQLLCD